MGGPTRGGHAWPETTMSTLKASASRCWTRGMEGARGDREGSTGECVKALIDFPTGQRQALSAPPARWLHDYLTTHEPAGVAFRLRHLPELCGYANEARHFPAVARLSRLGVPTRRELGPRGARERPGLAFRFKHFSGRLAGSGGLCQRRWPFHIPYSPKMGRWPYGCRGYRRKNNSSGRRPLGVRPRRQRANIRGCRREPHHWKDKRSDASVPPR